MEAKIKKKKKFAECQGGLALGKDLFCRVPNGRHSAKFDVGRGPLPKAAFAECPPLPSAWNSAKPLFTECYTLPSAFHPHALGKYECAECSYLPSATLGK